METLTEMVWYWKGTKTIGPTQVTDFLNTILYFVYSDFFDTNKDNIHYW